MKPKLLLFFIAVLGIAFFVYLLTLTHRCCVSGSLTQFERQEGIEETENQYLETKILHFGDLMLGRGVGRTVEAGVNPFEHISDFIHGGDFDAVVANLEGPFTYSETCQIKPYTFRFNPSYVDLLTQAGITGVSLANNHSNDCYEQGTKDTRKILGEAGINVFGDDANTLEGGSAWHSEEVGVVFLGFDMTLGLQSTKSMSERIREAARTGARVVVHTHWGNEYELIPNEHQREAAKLFADSGANLIVGHHPHVTQPAEIIGKTVVFYSLGNFVFDQDTLETQTGYALEERVERDLKNNEFIKHEFIVHPYRIVGHRPVLLDGAEKVSICERILQNISTQEDDQCSFALH
ncbi:MAG: CapA family protein [Candidatus Paceibacterota bacterium]